MKNDLKTTMCLLTLYRKKMILDVDKGQAQAFQQHLFIKENKHVKEYFSSIVSVPQAMSIKIQHTAATDIHNPKILIS